MGCTAGGTIVFRP